MINTFDEQEFQNSVALYITHTNPSSVKAAISPWKGKQEIELITDHLNQSCWAFRVIHSPLLKNLDSDDVQNFAKNLKKDNISVNQLYRIPICEVPQAQDPQVETLLHRAALKGSVKVFKHLLQNGDQTRMSAMRLKEGIQNEEKSRFSIQEGRACRGRCRGCIRIHRGRHRARE